jgi:hypothetical protein
MDEELKTWLQGMEDRTGALIAGEIGRAGYGAVHSQP